MNCVEVSNDIARRFPANKSSLSKRKVISGFGINDAPYVVYPVDGGSRLFCPAYSVWYDMVLRGFNDKKKKRYPGYADATVCEEWRSFMKFREWWIDNVVDGWQLDKDLLKPFNKEYSPEKCVFVPPWLNALITGTGNGKRNESRGACFDKSRGKYICMCSFDLNKTKNLGRFDTEEEAHSAWTAARAEYVKRRKSEIDAINPIIYGNLLTLIHA